MKFPKKLEVRRKTEVKHYEFVKEFPYVVQYRCLENGTNECFSKVDFGLAKGYGRYTKKKGAKYES